MYICQMDKKYTEMELLLAMSFGGSKTREDIEATGGNSFKELKRIIRMCRSRKKPLKNTPNTITLFEFILKE